jgi:hypothetical protein
MQLHLLVELSALNKNGSAKASISWTAKSVLQGLEALKKAIPVQ